METSQRRNRRGTLEALAQQEFDVVVVGGGITGSGIVRDAQSRGLKCLLLEKDDFASGTSSKSGKLIHGGLRYLHYAQFRLVFEACQERYLLYKRVAPHLVRPVPFLMSFYPQSDKPRWLIAIGLFLYDLLSLYRNIRRFRILSPRQVARLEPALKQEGALGGLSFYDCMGLDYRLTLDTLKAAYADGALLLNYCQVEGIELQGAGAGPNRLVCRDRLSGDSYEVRAKVVINAAGAWCDELMQRVKNDDEGFRMRNSRGIHLVFDNTALNLKHAIAFEGQDDHRNIYVVPWGRFLLLGTTDTFYSDNKDEIPIRRSDVDYLVASFNQMFPDHCLRPEDCLSAYAGIRPLIGSDKDKKESEVSRDFATRKSAQGFVAITGGKLTTYRYMAKKIIDDVLTEFFPRSRKRPSQTHRPISGGLPVKLSGAESQAIAAAAHVSLATLQHLIDYYGSNYQAVLSYAVADPRKAAPISELSPHIWAELDYALDQEFVVTLQDFLLRRSTLYLFCRDNGVGVCRAIAGYMAGPLRWGSERVEREVNAYITYVNGIKRMVQGGASA